MRFELNEYKSFLTDDEILADIKRVAHSLNVTYISISTYKKYGKYSQCAIQNHFGTWKNALSLAGLRNERAPNELKLISDDEYFSDAQRIAAFLKSDTVRYDDYKKYGKFSAEHIFKRFSTSPHGQMAEKLFWKIYKPYVANVITEKVTNYSLTVLHLHQQMRE